jgi:hypothetical protein
MTEVHDSAKVQKGLLRDEYVKGNKRKWQELNFSQHISTHCTTRQP